MHTFREIAEAFVIGLTSCIAVYGLWHSPDIAGEHRDVWRGIIVICISFIAVLLILKIIDLCKKKKFHVLCERFPLQGHICNMINLCLSDKYVKTKNSSVLKRKINKSENIFDVFYHEISKCLDNSKFSLKMTLPKDPYCHISDAEKKTRFETTANSINNSNIKNRLKIVSLTNTEADSFFSNLLSDIEKNIENIRKINSKQQIVPITEFDKYLLLHRDRNIQLKWHVNGISAITEYIIMDDSIYISPEGNNLVVICNRSDMDVKLSRFNHITGLLTTKQYIDKIIDDKKSDIESRFPDTCNSVITYLRTIK
jgi:hypothetical protein